MSLDRWSFSLRHKTLIQFLVMFVQVAFTGSTEIGQKIMEAAAQTNLKVHLPAIGQRGLRMFALEQLLWK
jgi:hypothetical protein